MIMINKEKLLNTDMFIKNPVDKLKEQIIKNDFLRIILTGGRGNGKSIVLYSNQLNSIESNNKFIYTRFDSVSMFSNEISIIFLNHYYEVIFSIKLLNYIKKYYGLIYETNFKDFELLLNSITKETDNYINNFYYSQVSLNRYLKPTELSSIILERFKKCLNIESITLEIDNFDWTHSSNPLMQNILSKFFCLFDKTIITTDDEELQDKNNRNNLINKGYTFIDIDYGKDIKILKEIISKRIDNYNQNKKQENKYFNIDIIPDEFYQILIDKTNGNISLMLTIIYEIINLWNWQNGSLNLKKQFDIICEKQIETDKSLKKMIKPFKLYL